MQKITEYISSLNKRQRLSLFGIVFLLIVLPLIILVAQSIQDTRQRASEFSVSPVSPPFGGIPSLTGVKIDLQPTALVRTVQDGQFQSTVYLNTASTSASGVDFTLAFNPNVLELVSFTPSQTSFTNELYRTINNTTGTLRYTAVSTQNFLKGNVLLGTLTFRPRGLGTSTVNFQKAQVTVQNYSGVLENSNQVVATYTIAQASPSATPSPITTPKPTSQVCAQVITFAQNPTSGVCTAFSTPCDVPAGWSKCIPPVTGDANGDRTVNIIDFNIWRDEFLGNLTTKQSDFNKDGKIDLIDFSIWSNAFANSQPIVISITPSSTPLPTQIPSPTPTPLIAKRVFVTSTTYSGNLGGLSGADQKCQVSANSANLGGTWKAWLSDSQTSASSRLTHANVPYKSINNTNVAINWADLTDGSLSWPILTNEFNVFAAQAPVWTGTTRNGNSIDPVNTTYNCNDWTGDSNGEAVAGSTKALTYTWTESWRYACSQKFALFCFEQ